MPMAVRRTPLMERVWKVHGWLYRASGGRLGATMQGMPVLLLTTTGRKSGEPRTVPLMYLDDAPRFVVIASNAGEEKHPAWWLNLKESPCARVSVGGRTIEVTAREAGDAEREQLWRRLLEKNDAYAVYQERTSRRIPVVILEPASR